MERESSCVASPVHSLAQGSLGQDVGLPGELLRDSKFASIRGTQACPLFLPLKEPGKIFNENVMEKESCTAQGSELGPAFETASHTCNPGSWEVAV